MTRRAVNLRDAACAGLAAANVYALSPSTGLAQPPPPPPPDVLKAIQADCRTAPAVDLPLAKTLVAAPTAPSSLELNDGFRLDPPPGSRIGKVVGVFSTWAGSVVAATDRGFWLRVPAKDDESLTPLSGAVAVSMRDLLGPPTSMVFSGWSGEPGMAGANAWVAVPGVGHLLRYEVSDCFPGAHPKPSLPVPKDMTVFRLEPGVDASPAAILEDRNGFLHYLWPYGGIEAEKPNLLVKTASASAHIPLAAGCDTLTFQAHRSGSLIQTSCSPAYRQREAAIWAAPQHQHRQPDAIEGDHVVGFIGAPVVSVSDAHFDGPQPFKNPVPRGDKTIPGSPCSFLVAAQAGADAPVYIWRAHTLCAYYPRDPSGAPYPPPPPVS